MQIVIRYLFSLLIYSSATMDPESLKGYVFKVSAKGRQHETVEKVLARAYDLGKQMNTPVANPDNAEIAMFGLHFPLYVVVFDMVAARKNESSLWFMCPAPGRDVQILPGFFLKRLGALFLSRELQIIYEHIHRRAGIKMPWITQRRSCHQCGRHSNKEHGIRIRACSRF